MSRSADVAFWAIAAAASAIALALFGLIRMMPVGLPTLEQNDAAYARLLFVGKARPPRPPSKLRPVGPTSLETTRCCFDCEPEPILAVLARLPNALKLARTAATNDPMGWFFQAVCVNDLVTLGVSESFASKLCRPPEAR